MTVIYVDTLFLLNAVVDYLLLLAAARLARSGRPAVVAIDGRCGSGKSGLGDLMGRLLPCNVVHMDDYYLPPDRRAENWEQIPADPLPPV